MKKIHQRRVAIIYAIFAFVLFTLATLYLTYPLIFHLTNFATGEYVVAWIFNWNIHSILTSNILHIFQSNIYYPYHNSLAFSDALFTSSVIAIIPFLFLHQPMVPSNVTFISSFILLGFSTYLLSYYITKNFLASLAAGMLVIFSPITIDTRFHPQMFAISWAPLSVLFFLMFCKNGKFYTLLISLSFFVLQTYNNFLIGYFLLFYFSILSTFFIAKDAKTRAVLLQWKNLYAFFFAFLLILLIAVPYFSVSKEFHYVREIRDTIHFAIQPEDLLVTDSISRLYPFLPFFDNAKNYFPNVEIQPGFFGLSFFVLTIMSIFFFLKQKKKNVLLASFLAIAFIGLILSFGPALHLGRRTVHHPFLIPLPYALFYYLAPGFQGFRNSGRFEMLFILTMPLAIAIMLNDILKKKKQIFQVIFYFLLFLTIVGEFKFPLHYEKAKTFQEFPKVYSWIATKTKPQDVILEVPMYNWDNNPFGDNQEVTREYYSTLHFRRIVGGGSGFSPPPWQKMAIDMFNNFPSIKTLATVRQLGVKYIIVHKNEYDVLNNQHWLSRGHGVPDGNFVTSFLNNSSGIQYLTRFNTDYVYKVLY